MYRSLGMEMHMASRSDTSVVLNFCMMHIRAWCRVCKRRLFRNYAVIKKTVICRSESYIALFSPPPALSCYKLKRSVISCFQ